MKTNLDFSTVATYTNRSQIARIITENWVKRYMYCPKCGNTKLVHFNNNKPVADFYCKKCNSEYELKSKNGTIGNRIADGAYLTMIKRITSNNNPNFFFMEYSFQERRVRNFIVVPKMLFTPSIIEKRKPLSNLAKRAGWTGCNICLNEIPEQGRIKIIDEYYAIYKENVIQKFKNAENLLTPDINARGWLFDVLICINQINGNEFSLKEIYQFEKILQQKHPENNNILPKIRQQLQLLRDKGFIEFLGNGRYRKLLIH